VSNLPMMPWWPRDFIAATRGWTIVERSLYRELLDSQWVNGSLPNDEIELARIAGATTAEFDLAWPRVRPKFPCNNGRLLNRKLEEHRELALDYRDRRSQAGRAGGQASARARADKRDQQSSNDRSTDAPPIVKHTSTSTSPSQNMENADDPDYQSVENLNHEAWEMWQAFRRKLKIRRYTTLMKARELAVLPESIQVECVNFSVSNSYYGLFPERFKVGSNGRKPTYAEQLKADIDAKH